MMPTGIFWDQLVLGLVFRPIKRLQKSPQFVEAFSQLGDAWDLPDRLMNDLDEFTCAMYGRAQHKDC